MARRNPNDSVQITSVNQCLQEFDLLKEALSLEETEDNWQIIDSSLKRFAAAVRGGACNYPDEFVKRWKETEIVRGLVSAMSTERTRLSGTALDLMGATSLLGNHWDSAVPFYAPTIVKLLGRASKIYVTRATNTLNLLIKGCQTMAFLPYLIDGISEKSTTIRIGCAEAILCCLSEALHDPDASDASRPRSKSKDVTSKRLTEIENVIKIGGRDRDPKVRAIIKRIWELYEQKWPTRATSLAQPFTPTIKRYLGISHSSILTSSVQTVSVPSGRFPTSAPLQNVIANQDTNQNQQKSLLKGYQSTGSKNAAESHLSLLTKNANHNSSKPIKSHNAHISFPKSGDVATLQKAAMVPLPRDESEHDEPTVASGSARARVLSARTRTPVEGSIHHAQQSVLTLKRSNSTMRAQRVPLSSHADLPAGGVNGSTRAPARVPLQSIQSTGHLGKDVPIKNHMNPLVSSHPESSSKPAISNNSTNAPKGTFKPTRVTSNTTQVDSKTLSQSHPTLPTRPLARRAVKEAPSDPVVIAAPTNNGLNQSDRSNTQSRKLPAEPELPIIKQTRKAFKPTKPSAKFSSSAEPSSSKSSSTKTVTDSNLLPPCHSSNVPSQDAKLPTLLQNLPEGLSLAASIPLPCSPSPPLSSSTLPSQVAILNPPPLNEPPLPLTPPRLLKYPLPLRCQGVSNVEQDDASTTITALTTSLNLQSSHSTQVISHELKSEKLKPLSCSFPSLGTPGPKICKSLPDDLIVPMSVPLPPSPNSPFPQLNLRTRFTPQIDRRTPRTKSNRSNTSPRPRAITNSSSLSAKLVAPCKMNETSGELLQQDPSCSKPPTVTSQFYSDKKIDEHETQQQMDQEGILVDFDHEDTIWVPRPPALHDDLIQLSNTLGVVASIREESDDDDEEEEDGPQEKRQRLGMEGEMAEKLTRTQNKLTDLDQADSNSPTCQVFKRAVRRDGSMFHWDLPDLNGLNPDDSDDKTISCLREQPPFLASDITINDGVSFNSNLIESIEAQNQSTPASGIMPQGLLDLRRSVVLNLSP